LSSAYLLPIRRLSVADPLPAKVKRRTMHPHAFKANTIATTAIEFNTGKAQVNISPYS
jgi:hypothetical protein